MEKYTSGGGEDQTVVGQTEGLLADVNSLDARQSLDKVVVNSLGNVEHVDSRGLEHITDTIGHGEVQSVLVHYLNASGRNLLRGTLHLVQEIEILLESLSRRNGISKLETNSHIEKNVRSRLSREVLGHIELMVRYSIIQHIKERTAGESNRIFAVDVIRTAVRMSKRCKAKNSQHDVNTLHGNQSLTFRSSNRYVGEMVANPTWEMCEIGSSSSRTVFLIRHLFNSILAGWKQ